MNAPLEIGPRSKVGEVLDAYPQLEETLIGLAPAFAKLRHPILRRTVARVATLESAARVGGLDPGALVAALRRAAGLDESETESESAFAETALADDEAPWLLDAKVAMTIDADAELDEGRHPAGRVEAAWRGLGAGSAIEIVASFRPEPLIDRLRGRGAAIHVATDLATGRTRVLVGHPRP